MAVRNGFAFVGRFGLYAGCAYISLFILASGYESIYNRALPFVGTLASVDIQPLAKAYNLGVAYQMKPSYYGQFGKPSVLTIPGRNGPKRLSIVTPIKQTDTWLARASAMHLLLPDKPTSGHISTAILYCRASFRTITAGTLPRAGSNLFIDTDQKWRYVYKVNLAKAYATSYPYVPGNGASADAAGASKGKLIIFCNDTDHKANDVIEADLISVQGISQ